MTTNSMKKRWLEVVIVLGLSCVWGIILFFSIKYGSDGYARAMSILAAIFCFGTPLLLIYTYIKDFFKNREKYKYNDTWKEISNEDMGFLTHLYPEIFKTWINDKGRHYEIYRYIVIDNRTNIPYYRERNLIKEIDWDEVGKYFDNINRDDYIVIADNKYDIQPFPITIDLPQEKLYEFFKSNRFKSKFSVKAKCAFKEPSYYTMREYFCNSHDDIAVEVNVFNIQDMCIGSFDFKWDDIHEVTSENIWIIANRFAKYLETEYLIKCRKSEDLETKEKCKDVFLICEKMNWGLILSESGKWLNTKWTIYTDGAMLKETKYDRSRNFSTEEIEDEKIYTNRTILNDNEFDSLKTWVNDVFPHITMGDGNDGTGWEVKLFKRDGTVYTKSGYIYDVESFDTLLGILGD